MGTEIAKLKSENKRTKTSIQKMKSFHAKQRMRALRDYDNKGTHYITNKISSRNSDGANRGWSDSDSDASSWNLNPAPDFNRRSMNVTGKTSKSKPQRNKLERVATAGTNNKQRELRRKQRNLMTSNDPAQGFELQELPEMKKSDSKLDILRMRLQQCQGENGMVDPARIL